jgi:hypothetical protein
MKKFISSLVVVMAMFAVFAVSTSVSTVNAAPEQASKVGPYEGTFNGTLYAQNGTKAPFSLNLTHRGNVVNGTVFLGEGLTIDAGVCGTAVVPSGAINANGKTSARNPKQLQASSSFEVNGINVTVDLDSAVKGNTISTKAKIDLPWICGGDPVLTGTLYKA